MASGGHDSVLAYSNQCARHRVTFKNNRQWSQLDPNRTDGMDKLALSKAFQNLICWMTGNHWQKILDDRSCIMLHPPLIIADCRPNSWTIMEAGL